MLSSTFCGKVTLITALHWNVCQLCGEINSSQRNASPTFWTQLAPSNLLDFHQWKGANLQSREKNFQFNTSHPKSISAPSNPTPWSHSTHKRDSTEAVQQNNTSAVVRKALRATGYQTVGNTAGLIFLFQQRKTIFSITEGVRLVWWHTQDVFQSSGRAHYFNIRW